MPAAMSLLRFCPAALLLLLGRVQDGLASSAGSCQAVRNRVDCAGNTLYGPSFVSNESLCVERGCCWDGSVLLGDDAPKCFYASNGSKSSVDRVLVIQSNHLDVGYADLVPDLINIYFDTYFPRAASVAAELRTAGGVPRLRWMTHSYLVSLYVDCPVGLGLHCPNASALENFTAAVRAGDIWWHAFPANHELAAMDPSLIDFSISMTHALDDRFGVPRKQTVSSRDVPGMDRSIIPLLKKRSIKMVTEGMNKSPWPVNMPPAFVWRDQPGPSAPGLGKHARRGVEPPSGETILAIWTHSYGERGIFQRLPNSKVAIAYDWRSDNKGPPRKADEVREDWAFFQEAFPGAVVQASTFDEIAEELERISDQLPVVDKESGDTWIFGCSSDPEKLAVTRILQRHRAACATAALERPAASPCDIDGERFANFSRLMTKNTEHTWGLSVLHFLGQQNQGYQNKDFHETRKKSYAEPSNNSAWAYPKILEDSWRDQKRFGIDAALEAIHGSALEASIRSDMALLQPRRPQVEGLVPVWAPAVESGKQATLPESCNVTLGGWITLAVDSSGALVQAADLRSPGAQSWSSAATPLVHFRYRAMTDGPDSELAAFRAAYLSNDNLEYGKWNCTNTTGCISSISAGSLKGIWRNDANTSLVIALHMPHHLHEQVGAPQEVWLNITASAQIGSLDVQLSIFNKTATRAAEAAFLGFIPMGEGQWAMDKLGEWVVPTEVVSGGSQGLHGVSTGVNFARKDGTGLFVEAVDAPIVSWGGPDPFPTPIYGKVDLTQGAHFLLWDNIWNTNYIFWWPYDTPPEQPYTDFSYRFALHFTAPASPGIVTV